MDEITLTGPTRVGEILDGKVTLSTIEPEDFGLRRCLLSELQGGDATANAGRDVLEARQRYFQQSIVDDSIDDAAATGHEHTEVGGKRRHHPDARAGA